MTDEVRARLDAAMANLEAAEVGRLDVALAIDSARRLIAAAVRLLPDDESVADAAWWR